jgi:gliding motility-associated-like protein
MKLYYLFFFSILSLDALSQVDAVGSGRAIQFDGAAGYVNYGDIYNNLTLPFTISAWVYMDPASGVYPIFCTNDNPIVYRGFIFFISPTSLGCEFGDGTGGNSPDYRRGKIASVQNVLGRWIHVTAVMSAPFNIDLYINGVNAGGSSSGGSNLPMAPSAPGDVAKSGYYISNSTTYRAKGLIDELRVWNRSLTQTEVQQNMCKKLTGSETGLIGYWNFDETSGATVTDKSPNGFNGQLMNSAARVFSGAPIGDDSNYQYSTNWSGVTFNFQDNNDLISVKNINGNPEGIHIYEVKNLPSQNGGLGTNISQPYFGVFAASLGTGKTFDVIGSSNGTIPNKIFSRSDNSVATWVGSQNPFTNVSERTEVIKGECTPPPEISLGSDQSFCEFKPLTLTPLANTTGYTFTWQDKSQSPTFQATDFGTYSVEMKNDCGSSTASVTFSKYQQPINFVPNVITPNGDDYNQFFKLDEALSGNVSLLVLNRWGKEVYKSSSYKNNWDGGGLGTGVYYYVISGPCIKEVKDWVMIVD